MLEVIRWIAKADFYNATPEFGSVTNRYWDFFLAGKGLGGAALSYFMTCVPYSVYEGNTAECWFRFFDREELWNAGHDYSYSKVLTNCGFIILATDQGGNPLFLDLLTGRLYLFQFGYLREGDILSRYQKEGGFIRIPATRESVISFCKYEWQDFDNFLSEVLEKTMNWHRDGLLRHIRKASLPQLQHYHTLGLGLPLDMTDDEGRTPLELAHETGNAEVIAIVESILRDNP